MYIIIKTNIFHESVYRCTSNADVSTFGHGDARAPWWKSSRCMLGLLSWSLINTSNKWTQPFVYLRKCVGYLEITKTSEHGRSRLQCYTSSVSGYFLQKSSWEVAHLLYWWFNQDSFLVKPWECTNIGTQLWSFHGWMFPKPIVLKVNMWQQSQSGCSVVSF